ncbi:HEAT repeat domain-containing protein [Hymenobacter sp. BT664]|uniref:HEAT repeat domain-containing protein n=1 Tax=Hymenobacter montanus TaxID=2771359 RepID=A0A927B9T6_9BACT|nr:HEAT repeat domain-containing protein [Hymenobacter montanus]MBD2766516.1 HEAT repeat domain-containing protein [Hymenobacter montanus]
MTPDQDNPSEQASLLGSDALAVQEKLQNALQVFKDWGVNTAHFQPNPKTSKASGEILVLEEDIGYEDFIKVAQGQGWIKHKTYFPDENSRRFEEVWATEDKANAIHYIDDSISGTCFLWVRGPKINELLFEIVRRLPAYEPEELIEMASAASEHDEMVSALFRIGVGFPNFDSKAFRVFEAYLTAPTPLLRKATVQAIAYRMWPESTKLLEKVVQEDHDEGVRQFAESILNQVKHRSA